MRPAARLMIATFGAYTALMGVEHGIGEMLQGSVKPPDLFIRSWPDSKFFEILSGEPALTIIPNMVITGVLAVIFSLAYLAWATWYVDRKNAGQVMMLLTIPMLLFGAGLFPPILGLLIGFAAWRFSKAGKAREKSVSPLQRTLASLFPWAYGACLLAWLTMFPGVPLLNQFFGFGSEAFIFTVLGFMFVFLLLAMMTASVRDALMRTARVRRRRAADAAHTAR